MWKLELLTDIGILLMIEKGIRGEICYWYLYMQSQKINPW